VVPGQDTKLRTIGFSSQAARNGICCFNHAVGKIHLLLLNQITPELNRCACCFITVQAGQLVVAAHT